MPKFTSWFRHIITRHNISINKDSYFVEGLNQYKGLEQTVFFGQGP